MKRLLALFVCICMLASAFGFTVTADDALFTIDVSVPSAAVGGKSFNVDITVKAVGDARIACACFEIAFDSELVSIAYDQADSAAEYACSDLIISTPFGSEWEQIVRTTDGITSLSFIACDTGTEESCIYAEETLKVSIPFNASEVEEDETVYCNIGNVYGADINLRRVDGSIESGDIAVRIICDPYSSFENESVGKEYTYTGLYQGSYPDSESYKLTDGIIGGKDDITYGSDVWIGLSQFGEGTVRQDDVITNYITLDMGETKKLSKFLLYAMECDGGVAKPAEVRVMISDNGKDFTALGVCEASTYLQSASVSTYGIFEYSLDADAECRYIKFVITHGGPWTFVSEVCAYSRKKELVQNTVVVDGVLDDNGWKADDWTHATPENSSYQEDPAYSNSLSYSYQLATDGSKLYVAVDFEGELVKGAGNGKSTFVRLWIRSNAEASLYTHFYDMYVDGDGNIVTAAKYNKALTYGDPEKIDNSSVFASYTSTEENAYFEMSIDLAEFTDGDFEYFLNVGNYFEQEDEWLVLLNPSVGGNGTANFPYNVWKNSAAKAVLDEMLFESSVKKHSITYMSSDGVYTVIEVEDGEKAPYVDAKLVRYVLVGWYTDKNCTKEYNFNSFVTGEFTLYSKWVLRGDVDGSGRVNSKDASAIMAYIAGNTDIPPMYAAACDTDGDGEVTGTDASNLISFIAGTISGWPADNK